jgi:hypothetical protein
MKTLTFKQKIVSHVIVGGLFRISEAIANIIMWFMKLFKTRKPYYLYIYLKYEQVFLYPLAEKICYCLGLRKEWGIYQEGIEKLHKLIFGEEKDNEK